MRQVVLWLLLGFALRASAAEDRPTVTKFNSEFPKTAAMKLGSGSGIVVGKNLILTNRHVATDDDTGAPRSGFRVVTGPTFDVSQGVLAKANFVSTEYDLALLETEKPLTVNHVTLLDDVAPLGTKVNAFGFPLGSEYGIGLTMTQGLVSRLPVPPPNGASPDARKAAQSLWHDAMIAEGSSGGPLFSEKGILIGLNFAYMVESHHSLAVPGSAVADFIRQTRHISDLTLLKSDELPKARLRADFKETVVFIEILDDGKHPVKANRGKKNAGPPAGLHDYVMADITTKLKTAKPQELTAALKGSVAEMYPVTTAKQIHAGNVVHVVGEMVIMQMLDEGVLAQIGGVSCLVVTDKESGKEFRAKHGIAQQSQYIIELVALCGKAGDYQSVTNSKGSFIPLIPLTGLVSKEELMEAAKAEKERRSTEQLKAERTITQKMATSLTRQFADKSGKFSTEAIFLGYAGDKAILLRTDNKRELQIDPVALRPEDRDWLQQNLSTANNYAGRIRKLYTSDEKASPSSAPDTPGDKK